MGWGQTAASGRQLLGQLSGQLTERAKMKAAQKQSSKDMLAGFAQQGIGMLGQQMMEKQQQAGRMDLVGEESRLRGLETADVHNLLAGREKALETQRQTGAVGLAKSQEEFKLQAEKDFARFTGVLAKDDPEGFAAYLETLRGWQPEGGATDDVKAALRFPSVWAGYSLQRFFSKEGIKPELAPATPEQWEEYIDYSLRTLQADYPDMGEEELSRFREAIEAEATHAQGIVEPDVGGVPKAGLGAIFQERKEFIAERDEVLQLLRDKIDTFDPKAKGKEFEILKDLLALQSEGSTGGMALPGGVIMSRKKLDSWVRRVRLAIGLSPGETLGTFEGGEPIPEHY